MTHGDGMTRRENGWTLPAVFGRLRAFLAGDSDESGPQREQIVCHALGVADLSDGLTGRPPLPVVRELGYRGHPFEVIPFAWNGGDALVYAFLVHDDRVPPSLVSYAPGDSPPGPVWLADDAEGALRHLMAVRLRDVARHAPDERSATRMRAAARDAVERLSTALGLAIVPAPDELTEGARSDRFIEPAPPEGWLFEPCNDEVGVLAPTDAFDPALVEGAPEATEHRPFDEERELAQANDLLARGYPASALAVARNVYAESALDADRGVAAARVMRRAYVALGRDFLARRVDAYVAAGDDEDTDEG